MSIEDLKRLKSDVNEIIKSLDRTKISGVNWLDLSCVSATHCVDDDGYEYQMVLIEEADPDCTYLPDAVRRALLERGWKNVAIETAW